MVRVLKDTELIYGIPLPCRRNKKHRPIFYQEFIEEESKRRRYWGKPDLRGFDVTSCPLLTSPLSSSKLSRVSDTASCGARHLFFTSLITLFDCPQVSASARGRSESHTSCHRRSSENGLRVLYHNSECTFNPAQLSSSSRSTTCISYSSRPLQVDGLHHKAHDQDLSTYLSASSPPAARPAAGGPPPVPDPPIVELHGTLRHAHCLKCHTPVGRDAFQDRLSALNPAWKRYSDEVQQELRQEKLNPDGDVELPEGVKYDEFEVPPCDECGGPMKPVSLCST